MDEFDLLRQALKEGILVQGTMVVCRDQSLILTESGANSKLKRIRIDGFDFDKLIIKPDKSLCAVSSIFKSAKGECQSCDYVVMTKYKGAGYLLYFELKSKPQNVISKFKATTCVMEYIAFVIQQFYGNDDLKRNYQSRYILFYRLPFDKQPLQMPKMKLNQTAETALELGIGDGEEIAIDYLIII